MLDTHFLLIQLPEDKFVAWIAEVEALIRSQHCPHHVLETLVGRLNHAAVIIPMAQHFLGRLRNRIDPNAFKQKSLQLAKAEIEDLKLWRQLLAKAGKGISMIL
jgi:hypothetical protein